MTENRIQQFFRRYEATAVGNTPVQPSLALTNEDGEEEKKESIELDVEQEPEQWKPITISEQPAREGEYPTRFIDGSHNGQPVFCVRSPQGFPIPLFLSEVGAVALKCVNRKFEREFVALERVLSFVADPFPWSDVEGFASDLMNKPELQLRVLPANSPTPDKNPFDYEVNRTQARSRAVQEMTTLEKLALAANPKPITLVDGPLHRLMGQQPAEAPLRIGVVKTHSAIHLHDRGNRLLLSLGKRQRTPVYRYEGRNKDGGGLLPVATWFLKLSSSEQLAPNWGFVRVEIPWDQFKEQYHKDFDFVNRLSGWLIDARCRSSSYARMPVSLEPIVRAEECLKPLFTPLQVLVNRLYRSAGFFRNREG